MDKDKKVIMKIQELSIGDWANVPNYYWDESLYVGQR